MIRPVGEGPSESDGVYSDGLEASVALRCAHFGWVLVIVALLHAPTQKCKRPSRRVDLQVLSDAVAQGFWEGLFKGLVKPHGSGRVRSDRIQWGRVT